MTAASVFDYQDAIMLAEEARLILRREFENDHYTPAPSNNRLRRQQHRQRQEVVRLARSLYLRALNIQEAVSGWCNEDTAQLYFELGWFEYVYTMNYDYTLGYLLQSLRISHHLYGSDHPCTMVVLDDIQDLLDDMKVDDDMGTEYVNRIFQSWKIQDQAQEEMEQEFKEEDSRNDEGYPFDCRSPSNALSLYEQALDVLPSSSSSSSLIAPAAVEFERALVYCQMASLASRQKFCEDALSYYCSALMRLPNWLSRDHPRIRTITEESRKLAREQLTPINGSTAAAYSGRNVYNPVATERQHYQIQQHPRQNRDEREPAAPPCGPKYNESAFPSGLPSYSNRPFVASE